MLLTKFFLPELRNERVDRPRLIERLTQASNCNLVIVSAPAGFGKTTLVSAWVRGGDCAHAAWVSLDEGDNDPVRFWTGLVTALESLYPGAGKNSHNLLAGRQPPAPEILLTALLNDLTLQARAGEAGPQPGCLVLDDTHLVTNAAIYEGLYFLAERLPRNLRLVLIGRSDPPLPLGRLRASGRVLEIRAADLRFTLAECEQFLNRVMGFNLPPDRVQRLEEHTEGWIAGLQLAGLALQGLRGGQGEADASGEMDAFIESFSGDDRYILDYLVEEVLSRLPDETRRFLLQTACLERMCGPLCEAVTGLPQGQGQALLERFERENLFLVPLDNRRQWYRYHHLFADLLRHQFERQEEGQAEVSITELHRRAAHWFGQQGLLPEAIGQALKGRDYEQAAQWIEAYAQVGIDRGEYATLRRWMETLPQTVLYSRPDLLLHYAWTLSYLGEVEQYEPPLAAAKQLWREQGNLTRLGEALNLRADFAAVFGDGEKTAELAQQALDLLPEADLQHRGLSWLYLGAGMLMQGRMEQARQAFSTGRALCERSGNTTGLRLLHLSQAEVLKAQGNLPEAARLLEEVLAQTADQPIYEGFSAQVLLSTIWLEWNRLEEAEQSLRKTLEIVQKTGQIVYLHQGYLILAFILWAKGDTGGMEAALEQHARLAEQVNDPYRRAAGDLIRAQLAIHSGDLQAAQAWRERYELSPTDEVGFQNEFAYLILARLLVRRSPEEAQQALGLLERLEAMAQADQRFGSLIEIWTLKALASSRVDDLAGALRALEDALRLARPGGYKRLFLDEGPLLADLLGRLARLPALAPDLRSYANGLLSLMPGDKNQNASAGTQAANQALVEPLTRREIEVLQKIQCGLSNREIAEQLYLTLNTVKVHVKNIFAKLQVENRVQAVRRAEELGLI